MLIMRNSRIDMVTITNSSRPRGNGGRVDVERSANAVHRVDKMGGAEAPANTQGGKAVNLGEGARGEHVVGFRRQLHAPGVVVPANVFGVSSVQHEQDIRSEPGMKASHLIMGQIRAGWVVGVGQEDDARAFGHRIEDRIDTGGQVGFRHNNGCRSSRLDLYVVDEEPVLRVNAFIARPEKALARQREQFV